MPNKKNKVGRPKGSFVPVNVPRKKELLFKDIAEANPHIKCRVTLTRGIKRLTKAGALRLDRQHVFGGGVVGRPSFIYINTAVEAAAQKGAAKLRLRNVAKQTATVDLTPAPSAEPVTA